MTSKMLGSCRVSRRPRPQRSTNKTPAITFAVIASLEAPTMTAIRKQRPANFRSTPAITSGLFKLLAAGLSISERLDPSHDRLREQRQHQADQQPAEFRDGMRSANHQAEGANDAE